MDNKKQETNQNQVELDRVFNMAWLFLYKSNKGREVKKYEDSYRKLQALIVNGKIKDKNENILHQIELLKVLDKVYGEIIDNGFIEDIEALGLSDNEAKDMLYQKVFGLRDDIDFSSLYDPKSIETLENGYKNVSYSEMSNGRTIQCKCGNTTINLKYIGKLGYVNTFGVRTYVERYSVIISSANSKKTETLERNIYSNINFDKLESDMNYQRKVIGQLLTAENIDRKDNEEYIGEISPKKEEKGGYGLVYSKEDYSAIKSYKEQSKRKKNEKLIEKSEEER